MSPLLGGVSLVYIFWKYGWFTGSPNCGSFGAVLEIYIAAWRHLTGVQLLNIWLFSGSPNCGSFGVVFEIFLFSLKTSAWDRFMNILLVLWISKLFFSWGSFGDISPQLEGITLGYMFCIYGWFSWSPKCCSFGAVLEIFRFTTQNIYALNNF